MEAQEIIVVHRVEVEVLRVAVVLQVRRMVLVVGGTGAPDGVGVDLKVGEGQRISGKDREETRDLIQAWAEENGYIP